MYVQVAVNLPLTSGVFDYHLPLELEGQVQPGCLVAVPFSRQTVQGIVLRLLESTSLLETRPVEALLDPQPVVTKIQMALAQVLAEETLTPLAICLDHMLPPGLSQHADSEYSLRSGKPLKEEVELSPFQHKLLALIRERGALRGRQIAAAFPHREWKPAAQALVRWGWLQSRPVLPPPSVRPRLTRRVQLIASSEMLETHWERLGRGEAGARRQAMIRFLQNEGGSAEAAWVYAASGGNLADLKHLERLGLVVSSKSEVWRDPLEAIESVPQTPPQLTVDQESAWQQMKAGIYLASQRQPLSPFLLHGVTGSGKTELYLRAVEETLRTGRQAIVLVPEIALTPQTVRRFLARFPGQVGLIHSRLSPGERYDTWRRARQGLLSIIVGPRSALFTPLPDPGLIVVDECHDDSYYQSENPPYYHAVSAAIIYARLANAMLVLGSATPPVNLTYRAEQEGWHILKLPLRILAHRQAVESQLQRLAMHPAVQQGYSPPYLSQNGDSAVLPLPPVQIVDMRHELKMGNRSIFSRALQNALTQILERRQQAILFLNRRGRATFVFCRECGYTLRCPRCDLPLTLHADLHNNFEETLICHTCNYQRKLPRKCPECNSPHFRMYGLGTEKLESELLAQFPSARVLRWDADTTRQKGAHDLILSHFLRHQADILVGTQMLAKGLDLPLVTLVGVILADVGLNFPDFRAGERTFQLLTQVAGRAGRSPLGGEVILQTFQPDHPAIRYAAQHDYEGFYRQELAARQRIGYPPFSRLLRLTISHADAQTASDSAFLVAQQLQRRIELEGHHATEMIGPAPCFFSRQGGQYRWQVILRGPAPSEVLKRHSLETLSGTTLRIEVDPPNLL